MVRARARSAGVLALTAALVAGCGEAEQDSGRPESPATASSNSASSNSVPEGFDAGSRWEVAAKRGEVLSEPVIAERSGRVVYLSGSNGALKMYARDVATGEVTWSSKTVPDVKGGDVHITMIDGREHVVYLAGGSRLRVYDTAARGADTAPVREMDVETSGEIETFLVQRNGVVMVNDTVVDLSTGEQRTFEPGSVHVPRKCRAAELDSCDTEASVRGMTTAGPLVAGPGAFEIEGRWNSNDVVRSESERAGFPVPDVMSPDGSTVLAAWPPLVGGSQLWGLHDADAGDVLAVTPCEVEEFEPRTSPNGRYVFNGPLVFDLHEQKAHCVDDGAVTVTAVSGGTAYGHDRKDGRAAAVPLGTGERSDVDVAPDAAGETAGVFGFEARSGFSVSPRS